MAVPQHTRMVCQGVTHDKQPGGQDLDGWSYSLSGIATSGSAFLQPAVKSSVRDAVLAFHGRSDSCIASSASARQIKVNDIGPDGRYASATPTTFEVTQDGGDAGGWVFPAQVALAVSLGTGKRGPSFRGRFYLPLPAVTMDTTGRMQGAYQSRILGSVKQLLTDLVSAGFRPAVVSSRGFVTPVTEIRIGRVLDTVRSRRASMDEAYATAQLAA